MANSNQNLFDPLAFDITIQSVPTNGNDSLVGTSGNDTINGLDGNDIILGRAGNDALYGDNGKDTLDGGDGNDYFDPGDGIDSVIGGDGNDTLYLDYYNETNPLTIKYTSTSNGTVSTGDTFQNIEWIELDSGTGNDTINLSASGYSNVSGGSGNDRITTGKGNDVLDGGDGRDTLDGGDGNDYFDPGDGIDSVIGGDGNDYLYLDYYDETSPLTITYTSTSNGTTSIGDTFQEIESVRLLSGSSDDTINLSATSGKSYNGSYVNGEDGNDRITTGSGDDILNGDEGNDTLNGGDGNDDFDPGDGIDSVIGGDGIDTLNLYYYDETSPITITYTSTSNGTSSIGDTFQDIESVTLSLGSGNDRINLSATIGDSYVYGGSGKDRITTGSGNDTLNGGFSNDNDTLNGGAGNDDFDPGDGIDSVIGGDGIDTLNLNYYNETSPITLTNTSLGNGTTSIGDTFQDIEAIYVVSGSGNDRITTGSGDDTLDGYDGNDTLNGGAGNDYFEPGDGIDSVIGGAGNDTLNLYYIFENSPITLTNTSPGNGTSSIGDSFQDIEAISIYSGSGNDSITTSSGDDYLNGGYGDDTLSGGAGNDTYVINSPSDQIIENIDEGIDTVEASFSYTLSDPNLENLILYRYGGNINGTGNAGNNRIKGNKKNNILTGQEGKDNLNGNDGHDTLVGGLGNDILTGGSRSDDFVFNAPTEGIDQITDFDYFSYYHDKISVSAAGFGADLVSGAYLKANQFTIGAAASTSTHRFVYDSATGALFFDSNGNASGGVTQFATLSTGLAMTHQDIYVTV